MPDGGSIESQEQPQSVESELFNYKLLAEHFGVPVETVKKPVEGMLRAGNDLIKQRAHFGEYGIGDLLGYRAIHAVLERTERIVRDREIISSSKGIIPIEQFPVAEDELMTQDRFGSFMSTVNGKNFTGYLEQFYLAVEDVYDKHGAIGPGWSSSLDKFFDPEYKKVTGKSYTDSLIEEDR